MGYFLKCILKIKIKKLFKNHNLIFEMRAKKKKTADIKVFNKSFNLKKKNVKK